MPNTCVKQFFFLTTSLACAFLAAPVLAQSYSNESGGTATFYGQTSPIFLNFDDGQKSYGNVMDNTNSNTRVGFNIDQEMNGGDNLRFNFETALGAPASAAFSQESSPDWNWEKENLRKIEVIWSGDFGKVSLGQGSMASDGIATQDLTETSIAGYVYRPDLIGGYNLRQTDGNLSDIQFSEVYNDFDGGRKGRIRYDTPSFNGVTFAVAYGKEILKEADNAEYYDIGMFYNNTAGDYKMLGAAGYSWVTGGGAADVSWKDEDGDMTRGYAGSFSLRHMPTGLTGKIAAGGDSDGGGNYAYGKLGWIGELIDAGGTAVSVDYFAGSDFYNKGSSSDSWGLQAVQYFENIGLEAYIAYSKYSYNDNTADYKDASSTLAGIRWKF